MLMLKAPAKINWYLRVLNRRSDGYHNISSLMQRITIFDELCFEGSQDIDLEVLPVMDIPKEKNLVYKAASLLRESLSIKAGALIRLNKNIPQGAGLGGGSSDAAYTILGLNRLWGLGLSIKQMKGFASQIGSDVPFFLGAPIASISGRGEIVSDEELQRSYVLLILKPDVSISTSWAYSGLKRGQDNKTQEPMTQKECALFLKALREGDIDSIRAIAVNDFEGRVFERYPLIGELKSMLMDAGAHHSLMSGSGSAVYGVFKTIEDAKMASVPFQHIRHFIAHTITNSDGQSA